MSLYAAGMCSLIMLFTVSTSSFVGQCYLVKLYSRPLFLSMEHQTDWIVVLSASCFLYVHQVSNALHECCS